MGSFIIQNAIIVNEGLQFNGSIYIKDGIIEEVFDHNNSNSYVFTKDVKVINAEGSYLLPGVIDCHVHFREPGLTEKGDFLSESIAAVAGGVTSIMDMPNTSPPTINESNLKHKFFLAKQKLLTNYSFYLGATNENYQQIMLIDKKHVCGIKLFLGSSTGNLLVSNELVINQLFKNIKIPIVVHCENDEEIKQNNKDALNQFGEDIPFNWHPKIRNEYAVIKSVNKAIDLAIKHDTQLHLLHVSTNEELDILKNLSLDNRRHISSEVCLHHLFFNDTHYNLLKGKLKINPAIRDCHTQELLKQALKKNIIDIVSSDHAPHQVNEKNTKYNNCPSGAPSIQHGLIAMLELYLDGFLSIEQIVSFMCHNPAKRFKIKKRGFIKKGFYADLCLINIQNLKTSSEPLYKCGWSNFDNKSFSAKVIKTFVNGNLVYSNNEINTFYKGFPLEFNY